MTQSPNHAVSDSSNESMRKWIKGEIPPGKNVSESEHLVIESLEE